MGVGRSQELILVAFLLLLMFLAACSGGLGPRPAIETVPVREGIDATLDGGTSAASSSEPEVPEPSAKKGASKPSAPAKGSPKKPSGKKR